MERFVFLSEAFFEMSEELPLVEIERDDESASCCQEGEGHCDTFSDEVIGPFHSIEEMFASLEED